MGPRMSMSAKKYGLCLIIMGIAGLVFGVNELRSAWAGNNEPAPISLQELLAADGKIGDSPYLLLTNSRFAPTVS